MNEQLVLASGSPRRKELLSLLGVDFIIRAPEVNESQHAGEDPENYVRRVSSEKASAVKGSVVLGADTCVVLEGTIYGKPVSLENAEAMLQKLSGKVHQVVSGVAVRTSEQLLITVVHTDVEFISLTQRLIDWYLGIGESLDKAGAYALQGAGGSLIKAINGSHSNVVGLPLVETASLLDRAGVDVMSPERNGAS
ncbi:MAG: septum formation inhibitor Maf [Acidimicrobiales bacterium MED-G01]|nr:MAG: septum formation inhibitor Maf [Acidimicrobiales bacterium MED-G01]